MKFAKLFLLGALTICVASCCDCRKAGKSRSLVSLGGNSWQLVQMDGTAVVTNDENYTLTFSEDGRVSGMGDCNRLNGGYENFPDGRLNLNQMASTRMFCPNQAQEDKFLKELTTINSYSIDGESLLLFADGDVRLILKLVK